MSRLMSLLGILLALVGLALIVLSVANPGLMQVYGVTPEAGAVFLVGGVLSFGLGEVISAIQQNGLGAASVGDVADLPSLSSTGKTPTSGLEGKSPEAVLASAPSKSTTTPRKSTAPSVAETISALEQAKSDIKTALGGMDAVTGSSDTAPVPDAVTATKSSAAVEEGADGELYVVEEKIIRGRPSRILSDETVEAETDEGWMRFENLEHLNEYLDSVEEGQS